MFPRKEARLPQQLQETLKKAVECCPQAEVLWLMAAKEQWLAGDVDGAQDAGRRLRGESRFEPVWLAAVPSACRSSLASREDVLSAGGGRARVDELIWLKAALLERVRGL